MMLSRFKGLHTGERVFIIGNGPSLNHVDLESLEDEFTFATNGISSIYDRTIWRPSYFVFDDFWTDRGTPNSSIEYVQDSLDRGITAFIAEGGKSEVIANENTYFYNSKKRCNCEELGKLLHNGNIMDVFSLDITECIYNFCGVMSPVVQICHYMGFREMYFLGIDGYKEKFVTPRLFRNVYHPYDHEFRPNLDKFENLTSYINNSSAPIKSFINLLYFQFFFLNLVKVGRRIPFSEHVYVEHFSSDYEKLVLRDGRHTNERMRKSHRIIEDISHLLGFEVYNCTQNSVFDVYEFVTLDNIL